MLDWICIYQSKILIATGLIFDFFGAILICKSGIIRWEKGEEMRNGKIEKTLEFGPNKMSIKHPKMLQFGIILLISGFFLQFIGTVLT